MIFLEIALLIVIVYFILRAADEICGGDIDQFDIDSNIDNFRCKDE